MDSSKFKTPMMQQYSEIKNQYTDCILFFRMGDFYEMFLKDAEEGSKILDITLTARNKGKDGKIPMAGVPYHAADSYIAKLVKAGYKVAICEQVSQPDGTGIVDREVIRVVTPGTVIDEKNLNHRENNYLMALTIRGNSIGLALADISTGIFQAGQIQFSHLNQQLADELARINPAECILPPELYNQPHILQILKSQPQLNIYDFSNWETDNDRATKILENHFDVTSLEGYSLNNKPLAIESAASLLTYLLETQKQRVRHITAIKLYDSGTHMVLDRSTILNLELYSTLREVDKKGSLIYFLDKNYYRNGCSNVAAMAEKTLIR